MTTLAATRALRSVLPVVAIGIVLLAAGCAGVSSDGGEGASSAPTSSPEVSPEANEVTVDRRPVDDRIVEASGMTVSGRDESVVLVHNDSGDGPYVYRVGPDGESWGRITLKGVEPRDWEAITRIGEGDDSRVLVGDIGDNRSSWPTVSVLEFKEPSGRDDVTVTPKTYRFEFADGSRDAEALMISPRTGRLYVVSKRAMSAAIYLAPEKLSTSRVNVLTKWRSAPALVTDAAFSPDGSRYALRSYTKADVVDSETGDGQTVGLPLQPQGESMTWTPDGTALLVGSEGTGQRILRVPVSP